jgi:hypothetical protein
VEIVVCLVDRDHRALALPIGGFLDRRIEIGIGRLLSTPHYREDESQQQRRESGAYGHSGLHCLIDSTTVPHALASRASLAIPVIC